MSRYIDADALLNELHKEKEENEKARMVLIDDDFETLIKDAPTVEPEPVMLGTWLATDKSKLLECSRCGETIFFESTAEIRWHYRYCHRCGAKMDEE